MKLCKFKAENGMEFAIPEPQIRVYRSMLETGYEFLGKRYDMYELISVTIPILRWFRLAGMGHLCWAGFEMWQEGFGILHYGTNHIGESPRLQSDTVSFIRGKPYLVLDSDDDL